MRCLGRTPTLRRCKRNAIRVVCHDHAWQPVAWILSLVSAVAVSAGLYQDLLKPLIQDVSSIPQVDTSNPQLPMGIDKPALVREALDDASRLLGVAGTFPSVPYSLMTSRPQPTAAELSEALRRIEYAESLDPMSVEAPTLKAFYFAHVGRPEAGVAVLQDLLRRGTVSNPERTHESLAVLLLKAGELELAANHAREAINLKPNVATFHNMLGMIYLEQQCNRGAEHTFKVAVRLDKHLLSAQNGLSIVLKRQRKYDEALEVLRGLVRTDPNYTAGVFDFGVTLYESGDAAGAVPWLRRATQLAPARADMWDSLAAAYERLHRYGDAVAARKEAVRLQPSNVWYHINLAIVLWRLKDYGGGTQAIEVACTLHPEYVQAVVEVLDKVQQAAEADGDVETVAAVKILRKIAKSRPAA